MRPVYDCGEMVKAFVAKLIPGMERGFEDNASAIGFVDSENRLIAGIVFHDWNPERGTIEFTGAGVRPIWLTRANMAIITDYAFEQCGCQMMLARTSEHNEHANRFMAAVGFSQYRIERGWGRNEAEIIHTLTDDAWRGSRYRRH